MRREYIDSTKLSALFVVIIILSFSAGAQIAEQGYPYTYHLLKPKSIIEIPTYNLKPIDDKSLKAEDKEFPSPYRYSSFEDVVIDISKEGIKTDIPDSSGVIWRFRIESEDAKSIQLQFTSYFVPPGAKLFIYNEDYSSIYGAFTDKNNRADSILMIADFTDNHLIIEYFEPYDRAFEGIVILGSIGNAYKDIFQSLFSQDEDGYVGINCIEGETWQNEKHSVCLLSFRIGNNGYICSGALINTTQNDGTPYMLTANHCIDEEFIASTTVAYFNYEQIGCHGNVIGGSQTLSGATLMSTGSASDYSLLKFDNTPPSTYQPFYAGWDASGQGGQSAAGIHHPGGEPKKISIEYSPPVSYDESIIWDDNALSPANSHWKVSFDEGITSEGSSGSPLFNDDQRITGQLHGGNDENSYYGKLSYSWIHQLSGFNSLKSYLDPGNSGITIIDGYYPENNKPDPQFFPEFYEVCLSSPIQIKGVSAFNPTGYNWSFSPNTITYMEGTNSTSQQPVVAFNTEENYNISLEVTNTAGARSRTMYNIISAGNTLNLEVMPAATSDSCIISFDSITLKASGAANYKWFLQDESEDLFYIINDTLNPVVLKKHNDSILDSPTDILVKITGTHGSCFDTGMYAYPLIAQNNDNIENAIQIEVGTNGLYSNKCAGIQEDEPEPDHTSCTGQDSWCDEYGTGENIVENSVWFYFIPATNDKLELRSEGFDNQIAVYEADTYEDVLAGDYAIVGANDDYTSFDYNPYIEEIEVTTGNTYWVQVDGSAGGTHGNFYLYLDESKITSTSYQPAETLVKIYPQPAEEYITLESNSFTTAGFIDVSIYNLSGLEVYSAAYRSLNRHVIDIKTSDWSPGIYVIRLVCDDKISSAKIVK